MSAGNMGAGNMAWLGKGLQAFWVLGPWECRMAVKHGLVCDRSQSFLWPGPWWQG